MVLSSRISNQYTSPPLKIPVPVLYNWQPSIFLTKPEIEQYINVLQENCTSTFCILSFAFVLYPE